MIRLASSYLLPAILSLFLVLPPRFIERDFSFTDAPAWSRSTVSGPRVFLLLLVIDVLRRPIICISIISCSSAKIFLVDTEGDFDPWVASAPPLLDAPPTPSWFSCGAKIIGGWALVLADAERDCPTPLRSEVLAGLDFRGWRGRWLCCKGWCRG